LYDLTELQRHANRLYGFSAQKTLELAQALYERHKLLSYPRTDSRHLSQDVARTLPKIVNAIAGEYAASSPRALASVRLVEPSSMMPRSAITTRLSRRACLRRTHRSMRMRRRSSIWYAAGLLSAWHDEHIWSVTTIITVVVSEVEDRFHSSGTAVVQPGWKVLDIVVRKQGASSAEGEEGQKLPSVWRKANRNRSWKSSRSPRRLAPRSASPKVRCLRQWKQPARRWTTKNCRRR
jgi:DNA topoisomerase-3